MAKSSIDKGVASVSEVFASKVRTCLAWSLALIAKPETERTAEFERKTGKNPGKRKIVWSSAQHKVLHKMLLLEGFGLGLVGVEALKTHKLWGSNAKKADGTPISTESKFDKISVNGAPYPIMGATDTVTAAILLGLAKTSAPAKLSTKSVKIDELTDADAFLKILDDQKKA